MSKPMTEERLRELRLTYSGAVWPRDPNGSFTCEEVVCDLEGNEVATVKCVESSYKMAHHRALCIVNCVHATAELLSEITRQHAEVIRLEAEGLGLRSRLSHALSAMDDPIVLQRDRELADRVQTRSPTPSPPDPKPTPSPPDPKPRSIETPYTLTVDTINCSPTTRMRAYGVVQKLETFGLSVQRVAQAVEEGITLTVKGSNGRASIDVDDVDVIVGLSDGRVLESDDLDANLLEVASFLKCGLREVTIPPYAPGWWWFKRHGGDWKPTEVRYLPGLDGLWALIGFSFQSVGDGEHKNGVDGDWGGRCK